MRLEKALVKTLRKSAKPLTFDEVVAAVRVGTGEAVPEEKVRAALAAVERSGGAVSLADGRWYGLRERGLAVGRIGMNRRGYGFVDRPGGDVYVSSRDVGGAMHGDIVAVRIDERTGRKGRSGAVVQVLVRANETVVGRYEKRGKVGLVTPTDQRLRLEIVVPHAEAAAGRAPANGDVVVARLTRYPTAKDAAQGVVEEIVGHETERGIDVEIIIREHGLRHAFPSEVEAAAESLVLDVGAALGAPGREDVRDWFTVTIDPVDARDFDDAITLERVGGAFRLGVHIADVSHYVPWGSVVDDEAKLRATSVYLVDRVLPMLPERLSNGLCSLNPGEDRLSMSVVMDLDKDGVVGGYRLFPSVMRSDRRLDYDSVDGWLSSGEGFPDEPTETLLRDLARLTAAIGKRRTARGGLDFETVEPKVVLAEDGTPLEVRLRTRTTATNMIEEAMILANEVVAEHMVRAAAPMVFRIHEDPDPDALAQVAVILKEFDYPIKDVHDASPQTFQKIVKFAKGRPEELLINSLLLRALERARYSEELGGHFGLASEAYCHFTSPIRRYPDLIVHRLLKARLAGAFGEGPMDVAEPTASMVPELPWLAEHSSVMEREAEHAEDESVKVKLCELMLAHLGETFDGIITGVTPFGMFVQLENTAEGLVHVTTMADDYYHLDAERFALYGERHGNVHRLGEAVRVRVVDVSVAGRRIDLELA